MIGKPGPFQVVDGEGCDTSEDPLGAPRRRHWCPNYVRCLDLAAALDWDSFTCRGCSGEVNPILDWRAHLSVRRDAVAKKLCRLPKLNYLPCSHGGCPSGETDPPPLPFEGLTKPRVGR